MMNKAKENGASLDSPYVGLMPYEERHAPLFFGRDSDREKIIANLRATRLTVFYGPSGVGKSSALHAGAIPHLRQRAQPSAAGGAPEFAVVYHKDWGADPLSGLAASIEEGVRAALPEEPFEPVPRSRDLAQLLAAWSGRFGLELLVILDQFEEYFLYHASETGEGTFADEFPKAVNRRDLPVHFLISLREDALSKLDRFKGEIPVLFNTRLPIGHLRDNDARAAVREPIPAYNRLLPPGAEPFQIEPELVEAVLEQVNDLKLKLGGVGQGGSGGAPAQFEIETPYLQLVMTRIWEAETKSGSRLLRKLTLRELGGAEQIVRQHLDMVMSDLTPTEQEVAATLFKYLVTPVGAKIAHANASLIEYATSETECTEADVNSLLKKLHSGERRILYPVRLRQGQDELDGHQIYHDALAPAILAWRTRHLSERAAKKAAKERRRTWVIAIAICLTVLLSVGGTSLFYRVKYLQTYRASIELATLVVADIASDDTARQKEGAEKLEQLKRQGADLSVVKPIIEKVAKENGGAAVAIQVSAALETNDKGSTPTSAPNAQLKPRVYIHIQDERQRENAGQTEELLERNGFIVPGIELVSNAKLVRNELRYFREWEKDDATAVVNALRQKLDIGEPKLIKGFENSPNIRPKHFELWLKASEEANTQ
jgi:hypothetical protein